MNFLYPTDMSVLRLFGRREALLADERGRWTACLRPFADLRVDARAKPRSSCPMPPIVADSRARQARIAELVRWCASRCAGICTGSRCTCGAVVEAVDTGAAAATVLSVLTDWPSWSRTFPATIDAVHALDPVGGRLVLEVDHRAYGRVVNVLDLPGGNSVRLGEIKPDHDACFLFLVREEADGSRLEVRAHIRLRGWRSLLKPLIGGLVRSRLRRYSLQPIRIEAERRAQLHDPEPAGARPS